MLRASAFGGSPERLSQGLVLAVRDATLSGRLHVSLDGVEFLSMPELAALVSALWSADQRGIQTRVTDLTPDLATLLSIAGVSFPSLAPGLAPGLTSSLAP